MIEFSLKVIELHPRVPIATPDDVLGVVHEYRDLKRELMLVLHIMPDMHAHYLQRAAIGSSQSICFDTRDIFREAIVMESKAIIMAHNHPYEDTIHPTKEDFAVTRRMYNVGEEAGIHLLDHIVFGRKSYYSMFEQGQIFPTRPFYVLKMREQGVSRSKVVRQIMNTRSKKGKDQLMKKLSSFKSDIILR